MATIDLGKIKLVWRGTYAGGTAYTVDDVVQHTDGGITSSFICTTNSTGNAPSTGGSVHSSWAYLAKGSGDATLTTQGDILYRDGSGNQRLAKGTAGQVLKMNSGANAPEWGTDSGGSILQIVAANGREADHYTNGSSLTQVTDSSISITPSSASSRIWVQWQVTTHQSGNSVGALHAYRGSTDIGNVYGCRSNGGGYHDKTTTLIVLDHPNTTSATTYSLYMKAVNGSSMYGHRAFVNDSNQPRMRMMAMEISSSTQWTS